MLEPVISVVVRPRSPALAPFVTSLGYVGSVLPSGRERVLPSGHMSLMVNLHEDAFRTYEGPDHATVHRTNGAVLAGPRARHTVIDTEEQRCLVEVNFELGGAAPFFAVPPSATRDHLIELEALWGRDGGVLRERLLEAETSDEKLQAVEAALLEHLARPSEADPAVAFAAAAFGAASPCPT